MEDNTYVARLGGTNPPLWKSNSPLLGKLDLELTERCNNNCIHCSINRPADDRAAREKELSTGEIGDVLKEAVSLGCLTVRFTGGEPLLRDDFEELYLFARRRGLRVLLCTNATLITPHLAELFARIPPLEMVEITVYGMREESYEAVTRSPGSFEAAWQGMNLLLEKKVPFGVKGALLPANREEMEEFEAWASAIPWMDRPAPWAMFFNLRARRDSEEKNRLIRRLRLSAEEGLRMLTREPQEYRKAMVEFCSGFIGPPGDRLFTCGSGIGSGCVDAYGFFQPCLLLRHPDTVYDLRKGSLKDGLTRFFPEVRERRAKDPDYLNRCARCFLKGLCEHCPAKSWTEHGVLDRPVDYLCEIAHAQARYLGLLGADENAWEVRNWRERIESMDEQSDLVGVPLTESV